MRQSGIDNYTPLAQLLVVKPEWQTVAETPQYLRDSASVGLTEQAARDLGIDVEIVEYDLGALAATSIQRKDYRGRAQLVIDHDGDILVGATFVGPEVAELVHAATIAIVAQVSLELLRHAVPSYPTVSEIWLRLLESRDPSTES